MPRRSLYQCFNAKCRADKIFCAKGHRLSQRADGTVPIENLAKGEPLEAAVCQPCLDYDEMGPPVPVHQRGWTTMYDRGNDTSKLISDLPISTRTWNSLRRVGIETISQFLARPREEILRIRNFGEKSLDELLVEIIEEGIDLPEQYRE